MTPSSPPRIVSGDLKVSLTGGVFVAAIALFSVSQRASGQSYLNDLPYEFRQAAQGGFEAAVETGDERLIRHFGGHVGAGGRVFGPGEDEAEIVFREAREAMEGLHSSNAGMAHSPSFRPSLPGSAYGYGGGGSNFGGREPGPPRASFNDKKKLALEELRGLVDVALRDSNELTDASVTPQEAGSSIYLPAVSALLENTSSQGAAKASKSPTQDHGGNSSRPLDDWATASTEVLPAEEMVHGLLKSSDKLVFLFLDSHDKELPIQDSLEFLSSGEDAAGSTDGSEKKTVRLKIPPTMGANLTSTLGDVVEELQVTARQRRLASEAVSPVAAYRWTFGQVFDVVSPKYLPFRVICPRQPKIRIAVAGNARCSDGEQAIDVQKVLVYTTPLPSHVDFIAEHKGVPAFLIDLEQVHRIAFVECKVFCQDTEHFRQKSSAVWKAIDDHDAYLRSILLSPIDDINKMTRQMRDEVHLCTDVTRNEVLAESAVSRGLQAAGLDKKQLPKYTRLLVSGVGRKIVDQFVALGGGRCTPHEGVTNLAQDLLTFGKLAKDPAVIRFVKTDWLDSFLILVIDHNGVCLCDLSTMLSIRETYSSVCVPYAADDAVGTACRFAEIGTWFNRFRPGDRLPWKPPFSTLPEGSQMRRRTLDGFLTTLPTPEMRTKLSLDGDDETED